MAKPPINKEWEMERERLFDKSRDELKWRFVRARFGSSNVFCKAEIEEWLDRQRKQADLPQSDLQYWQQIFSVQYRNTNLEPLPDPMCALTSCATSHVSDVFMVATPFAPFLRALAACLYGKETIRIYEDCEDDLLVLVHSAVYDVLLDEWQGKRPRCEEARAFLCDVLDECVKRERGKAEADFERAVAVSPDGVNIVCCDEVVVIDGMKAIFFPAAAFAGNKILENPNKHRFSYDHPMNTESLRQWLEHIVRAGRLEKTGRGQFFSTLSSYADKAKDKDRFITDIRYCPDPLPGDGVMVQLS